MARDQSVVIFCRSEGHRLVRVSLGYSQITGPTQKAFGEQIESLFEVGATELVATMSLLR